VFVENERALKEDPDAETVQIGDVLLTVQPHTRFFANAATWLFIPPLLAIDNTRPAVGREPSEGLERDSNQGGFPWSSRNVRAPRFRAAARYDLVPVCAVSAFLFTVRVSS